MSAKELTRVGVVARVKAGRLTVKSTAVLLHLGYRQTKRLLRQYRAQGAKGLRHGSAGRRSNRACPAKERKRILTLVRKKDSGPIGIRFGPTLAAAHLAQEDGVHVHHDTLRRWMLGAGLLSRARKHAPHRSRRARKAHVGELVRLDGSVHRLYEDRAPQGCLMTLVNDATRRTLGQLGAQETIWAAVAVLRRWIAQYGVPHALYTDWKNVYVRPPNAEEQVTGAAPLTQFGRMCAALDLRIIAANSPQAKRRVERNHGTHQDRLVKKLRRLQIVEAGASRTALASVARHSSYLPSPTNGRRASIGSGFSSRPPVLQPEDGRALRKRRLRAGSVSKDRHVHRTELPQRAAAVSPIHLRAGHGSICEVRGRRLVRLQHAQRCHCVHDGAAGGAAVDAARSSRRRVNYRAPRAGVPSGAERRYCGGHGTVTPSA